MSLLWIQINIAIQSSNLIRSWPADENTDTYLFVNNSNEKVTESKMKR